MVEDRAEGCALFFLLLFAALGVWNIVHYGMLLGRTNVADHNRSASDDLEIEDIMNAQKRRYEIPCFGSAGAARSSARFAGPS